MPRAAVVQIDATGPRAAVCERAVVAVERGAAAGATLVVLPEYSSGWAPQPRADLAEPLDGPFVTAMREVAGRAGVGVVVGVVAPAQGGDPRLLNLAVAIDADGEIRGRYAKVHLFDAFGFRESDVLAPGNPAEPPLVIPVGDLRFGVLTCYDIRFPESARRLVDAGADALVVLAAWADGPGKADQLRVLARARAIENTAFLLLSSQSGSGRAGGSAIIEPFGGVLVEATTGGETLLVADLAADTISAARARIPVLANRRYRVVPVSD